MPASEVKAGRKPTSDPPADEPQRSIRWADQSEWFDMPKQQRSRETMQRVFDAAIKLFSSRGFDATTADDIAREAGVTKGSIYRRFQDKEGLLYTIIEAYGHSRVPQVERMIKSERWQGSTAREIIEFYMSVILSAYRQDAHIIRIIERRALVDKRCYKLIEDMNDFLITSFSTLLAARPAEVRVPDIARAMGQAHRMVRGGLVHLILADDDINERSAMLNEPDLDDAIRRTILAFLPIDAK